MSQHTLVRPIAHKLGRVIRAASAGQTAGSAFLFGGKSAAESLHILQQHGYTVAGLAVVFRYGWRNPEERLKPYQIPIHSLATLYPNP